MSRRRQWLESGAGSRELTHLPYARQLDAGGIPVEIASGIGGLAYSYFIGKRRGYGTERILYKPHNVGHVILGTVLLWVGWLGFNAGSTFAANLKAAMAAFNTNLAGSVG